MVGIPRVNIPSGLPNQYLGHRKVVSKSVFPPTPSMAFCYLLRTTLGAVHSVGTWKYMVVATLIVLLVLWATHLFVIFDTRLPMPHGAH